MKLTISNKLSNFIAVILLPFVAIISIIGTKDNSLTFDEQSHLPAGYSYLTQRDIRLNPEHPPVVKDLAAIPLIFIKGINFPYDSTGWTSEVNGQWTFGHDFIYGSGNPAEKMIFWGRMPMILILLLLGFYVYKWAREIFGNTAGLLALILFSFSPTLLAHGVLVTTDVGAATGILIATYYFTKALKEPVFKNVLFAGIAFGIAELLKFSTILLIPFFFLLGFVWWIAKTRDFWKTLKTLFLTLLIGVILIWIVYAFHISNYPLDRNIRDMNSMLSGNPMKSLIEPILTFMMSSHILRPLAQYLLGIVLVIQRSLWGHTIQFMGQITKGDMSFFPIVYLIKEPLAFHILSLISLIFGIYVVATSKLKDIFTRLRNWIVDHFAEFSMITFLAIYWAFSLKTTLHLGVRHLMPVFPLMFVLVGIAIIKIIERINNSKIQKIVCFVLGTLLLWQVTSVMIVFPHFLSYFNESVGSPSKGYFYATDSNIDWGQELLRLKKWMEKNNVNEIYLDYFGGADTSYTLGDKFRPWWGERKKEELPSGSYLAVSVNALQGGRAVPVESDFQGSWGHYLWLDKYTPIAKIGNAIFVYYFPNTPR